MENLALSGRSSWSYTTEANYGKLTSGIASGDYLFIGFGHNDERREVARYTDPTLSADNTSTMIGANNANRTVSFKHVLKSYYIDVAKAAGTTPVLCTPITRLYEDSKQSSYDNVHVTVTASAKDDNSGVTTVWNGGDYAKAIRELAAEEGLLCIDLTTITKTDYKQSGYDVAVKYHAATGAKWTDESKTEKTATGIDATHTNLYGAKMNAYYIANAVKSSGLALAANIKTNIARPVYADNATAIINANYEAQYKWYGTAFGKNASPSNYLITQSTEGGLTFTVKETTSKGKIESSNDSIAAVFIQVPFKTAFSVSATAKVVSYGGNRRASA